MRNPLLAFALAVAALMAATPRTAAACSCTNNLTLQQEFDYAYVVFSGRVLAVETDPFGTLAVMFEPLQRWKGPLYGVQVVVTALDSGACGFDFTVGESYLVFGRYHPYGITLTPTPWADLCQRTSLLADNPLIAQLPPPLAPTETARRSWGALKRGPAYR